MRKAGFRAALITAALAGTVAGLVISGQLNWTPPALTDSGRGLIGSPGAAPVDFVTVAKRVTPAVVSITTSKTVRSADPRMRGLDELFGEQFFGFNFGGPRAQRTQSLGSGVIVTPDGLAVTNNHVVEGADAIEVVLNDKRRYRATIVGTDPKTDMAVIRLEGAKDVPHVPWGDSESVQIGEWVLAIGNPLGLNSTVTAGIISAAGRADVGVAEFEDFLQTDAAINQGNSGGALVNLRGEVIGINTAIASRSGGSIGIGFAIPSRMAKPVMEALVAKGKVTRGYLGIGLEPMTDELAKSFNWPKPNEGILIAEVQPGTPAAVAGLKDGDIIVKLNGKTVDDINHFRNRVALTAPGTKVELELYRDGKTVNAHATLAELPGSPRERPQRQPEPAPAFNLGFRSRTLTPELANHLGLAGTNRGAVVTEVSPASAAAAAGLERGDLIVAMNRHLVRGEPDLARVAATLKSGDSVLLRVQRGEASRYLAFRLE